MRIYTNRKGQIRGYSASPTEYVVASGLSVLPLLLGQSLFFCVFCNLMRTHPVITIVGVGVVAFLCERATLKLTALGLVVGTAICVMPHSDTPHAQQPEKAAVQYPESAYSKHLSQ